LAGVGRIYDEWQRIGCVRKRKKLEIFIFRQSPADVIGSPARKLRGRENKEEERTIYDAVNSRVFRNHAGTVGEYNYARRENLALKPVPLGMAQKQRKGKKLGFGEKMKGRGLGVRTNISPWK